MKLKRKTIETFHWFWLIASIVKAVPDGSIGVTENEAKSWSQSNPSNHILIRIYYHTSGFLGARGQNVQLHFMQTMDGNFVPESVVYLVMKVSIQESVQEIKWSSGYAQNGKYIYEYSFI